MARIAIADAYETVEVDLWGEDYLTVDIPRSGIKKATALEEKLEKVEDVAGDVAVDLIGQLLDLKLRPANGGRSKASTVIRKKWQADELTVRQLDAFLNALREAEDTRPS